MSVAAFFNGIERLIAPDSVVARQRDQLLNLNGTYDAPTPAAPQTPVPAAMPTPDAALAAQVAQGTANIRPVGIVGPSGGVAPGDANDPYARLDQAGRVEDYWNGWATANNIDALSSREIGGSGRMSAREILMDRPASLDSRYAELPASWSADRKEKAIRFMRGQR